MGSGRHVPAITGYAVCRPERFEHEGLMNTALYFIAGLAALVVVYLLLAPMVRVYERFRGKRLVTCPETRTTAAVEVDAAAAAIPSFGERKLQLKECTRWPERQACGQDCLSQIEASPEDCLVRNMLERWYAGKSCAICQRPLGDISWTEHKPALLSPDNVTLEWKNLSAEHVPEILASHLPVCWNCHIAATFRREHPDLIVERPGKRQDASRIQ